MLTDYVYNLIPCVISCTIGFNLLIILYFLCKTFLSFDAALLTWLCDDEFRNASFCCLTRKYFTRIGKDLFIYWFEGICTSFQRYFMLLYLAAFFLSLSIFSWKTFVIVSYECLIIWLWSNYCLFTSFSQSLSSLVFV